MFLKRFFSLIVLSSFVVTTIITPNHSFAADAVSSLPLPGTMVSLSPAFEPVLMKGIKVHPENPFEFDFILDTGHTGLKAQDAKMKEESERLIKYFLAAMTVPEKDLWVNLSPYEKDRMIADNLGQTEMGRDMLAQDYILKQLTASLIYPEKELGQKFWNNIFEKTQQKYGNVDIPVNTFNKVWIVADKADIFEQGNVAYVAGAHLKVMLEEDYLATNKNRSQPGDMFQQNQQNVSSSRLPSEKALSVKAPQVNSATRSNITNDIIREIIVPEIEKEVNQGKNFAPLRQMFYSMILASWYKTALKDVILTQIYGNQSKVNVGINVNDPSDKDKIFQRYLQAYKKGVFNYIKEDKDALNKQLVQRKYFSGGVKIDVSNGVMNRNRPLGSQAMTGSIVAVNTSMKLENPSSSLMKAKTNMAMVTLTQAFNDEMPGLILEAMSKEGIPRSEATRNQMIEMFITAFSRWYAKHGFDISEEKISNIIRYEAQGWGRGDELVVIVDHLMGRETKGGNDVAVRVMQHTSKQWSIIPLTVYQLTNILTMMETQLARTDRAMNVIRGVEYEGVTATVYEPEIVLELYDALIADLTAFIKNPTKIQKRLEEPGGAIDSWFVKLPSASSLKITKDLKEDVGGSALLSIEFGEYDGYDQSFTISEHSESESEPKAKLKDKAIKLKQQLEVDSRFIRETFGLPNSENSTTGQTKGQKLSKDVFLARGIYFDDLSYAPLHEPETVINLYQVLIEDLRAAITALSKKPKKARYEAIDRVAMRLPKSTKLAVDSDLKNAVADNTNELDFDYYFKDVFTISTDEDDREKELTKIAERLITDFEKEIADIRQSFGIPDAAMAKEETEIVPRNSNIGESAISARPEFAEFAQMNSPELREAEKKAVEKGDSKRVEQIQAYRQSLTNYAKNVTQPPNPVMTIEEVVGMKTKTVVSSGDAAMTVEEINVIIAKSQPPTIIQVNTEEYFQDLSPGAIAITVRYNGPGLFTSTSNGQPYILHTTPGAYSRYIVRLRRLYLESYKNVPATNVKIVNDWIDRLEQSFKDAAMLNSKQINPAVKPLNPGGIDLNRDKMQMNVRKDAVMGGVNVKVDQATIDQIRRQGFDGLNFTIRSITPASMPQLIAG